MADKRQTQLNAFVRGGVRVHGDGVRKTGKRTLGDDAMDAAMDAEQEAEADAALEAEQEHEAEGDLAVEAKDVEPAKAGWVQPLATSAPAPATDTAPANPWKKLR